MPNRPKIAIIGLGRWGKKLLAEFSKQTEVVAVCHQGSAETSTWLAINYPQLPILPLPDILKQRAIIAMVIATPPSTHHQIAVQALKNDKDVWVEKPVGVSVKETIELAELANRDQKIMIT